MSTNSGLEQQKKVLNIRILGKEFQVSCLEQEVNALQKAVQYLDGKMRDIRNSGKIVGMERIAIMAALNIAHEFMALSEEHAAYREDMNATVRHLKARSDRGLAWEEN